MIGFPGGGPGRVSRDPLLQCLNQISVLVPSDWPAGLEEALYKPPDNLRHCPRPVLAKCQAQPCLNHVLGELIMERGRKHSYLTYLQKL